MATSLPLCSLPCENITCSTWAPVSSPPLFI
jgi:hypothetical protein